MTQTNKTGNACCGFDAGGMPFRMLKALCDPSRAAILAKVASAGRPLTVSETADGMNLDISVVSRHMGALRDSGILICEKKGREVYCRLDTAAVAGKLRALAGALEACCPERKKPASSMGKKAK
ncbi:MAG: helix-turn-helix transcriptional regulator [Nitrospinae bacterium]|nr:helix-turn-helix transcriptional regulator [Nitrospinota bacterium]